MLCVGFGVAIAVAGAGRADTTTHAVVSALAGEGRVDYAPGCWGLSGFWNRYPSP